MPRKSTWVERQQRRHDSRFFQLLDNSFLFRLALSAAGALSLLLLVNSYANCRNNQWAEGCLWRDTEALISVGNVESLSIVTAAFLYGLEGQKRKQRDNLEAYELLKTCNELGARWLLGRIQALEILNRAGLRGAGLRHAILRKAILEGADLSGTNLPKFNSLAANR